MNSFAPSSIADALRVLRDNPASTVIAGGTDVMVQINAGRRAVTSILSLRNVGELRGWSVESGRVRIGAGCTYAELERPDLALFVPALTQAARTVGSPQIRNAGTIGGNLATASPAGDTLPVLVALDAQLELASATASRVIAIGDFLVGPKQTALQPGELIVSVSVPVLRGAQEFLKVGTRNAMVISVASVAVLADLDAQVVRIGLGTVGPTVLRSSAAEAWTRSNIDWRSNQISGDLDEFVELVRTDAQPIDDHRSTKRYRSHAVGICARRALQRVFS